METHKLVLYKSDKDASYTIACLIRFCNYEPLQAEQSALLLNIKGDCSIKSGEYFELLHLQQQFDKVQLKTKLIEYEGLMY